LKPFEILQYELNFQVERANVAQHLPNWNGGDLTAMAHTLSSMHPPQNSMFHQEPIAKSVSPLQHQQMLPMNGMISPIGNNIIGSPPQSSILGTSPMNHGMVIRSPIRNQTPELDNGSIGSAELHSEWESSHQRPHAHNQAMYAMQSKSPEPLAPNVPSVW
jgi:hypothetical protein